ncbi:MAG: hypothetical protein K0S65_2778 [Labilithrix sp.]|nr:hypothetical protein [Labilithrix sp.]
MSLGRAVVVVAVFAATTALGCSGCSDKHATAAPDAAASLAEHLDAGDGGGALANVSDGGSTVFDDTAMPAATGEDLQTRMRHLLEAISQNNPDLAGDALFPRDGYIAAKDVADPQKAWEKKVSIAFRRSVERTHKKMKGSEHAKFVSFELGHSVVQLTPKKKDFKKPLWRVKHSKLTFTIDGKTRHLEIAEMTAWRGAWYVTRLR